MKVKVIFSTVAAAVVLLTGCTSTGRTVPGLKGQSVAPQADDRLMEGSTIDGLDGLSVRREDIKGPNGLNVADPCDPAP